MWVFLNESFLSIVADRHSDRLLVRARVKGDIQRVFPTAEVVASPSADYAYRAFVDRELVANALYWQAQAIGYDNFKNSVREHDRHDAYMGVWSVMNSYQRRKAKPAARSVSLFDEVEIKDARNPFSPVRPSPLGRQHYTQPKGR